MYIIDRYLRNVTSKNDNFIIILLILLVTLKTNALNYVNWNSTFGGWINNIFNLGFLFYWVVFVKSTHQMNFKREVYLMMFLPFLSIFNSWNIYDQSPISSAWGLVSQFTWVIYFLLHKYRVSESAVVKVLFLVSIVVLFIQIVQQFTYPNALFGVVSPEQMIDYGLSESASLRNGLWRFNMHYNAYFTAPILFVFLEWLQKKFNIRLFFLILLLLTSVYLTLTRQVMISCIVTIFYSMSINKKSSKLKFFIFICCFVGCLYFLYDILFSSLVEQTSAESNEDNIRLLSAAYFWDESLKTPFTFLFGIGKGVSSSSLEYIQRTMSSLYGFYVSDVGFIGEIYESGIFYVILSYYILYKLFFTMKNSIPKYVRLFVLFTVIMSPMIFPFLDVFEILVWTMLLYVSDLHINSNKMTNIYEK